MQERSTKELEKELSACEEISDFLEQNREHMHSASVSEQLRCYMEEKSLSRSDVIARCGLKPTRSSPANGVRPGISSCACALD